VITSGPSHDKVWVVINANGAGLCGNAMLVEIGGPPYLLPSVSRDKLYDLRALLQHVHRDPALLIGAGAGPWPHIGVNCEVAYLIGLLL
jgi:hypothetical protein